MKMADDYDDVPRAELARLAANQANEITGLVKQNQELEAALHMRRLQVATFCEDAGLKVDGDCMGALRRETLDGGRRGQRWT